MKKLFLALTFALSSFAASASAATLPLNFTASDGKVFQINTIMSVEKGIGVIYAKTSSGNFTYMDATGAVWAKLMASAEFARLYVKVPNTDRYMNTTLSSEISCVSNQTVFGYFTYPHSEWFQDNCALHTVVKNASN